MTTSFRRYGEKIKRRRRKEEEMNKSIYSSNKKTYISSFLTIR